MKPRRKAKIVATLGPRTANRESIHRLIRAGMDVARVNCSHGGEVERGEVMKLVREEAVRLDVPVAILVDLMGPRIRVGELSKPVELIEGREVVFAPEGQAADGEIPTTYDGLAADVQEGSRILLNDGVFETKVVAVVPPRVHAQVLHGGTLEGRKGINLPGVRVSAPALTDKDMADAEHAARAGADYIALSFVRQAEDMEALRRLVPQGVGLVAKIEKDQAVDDSSRILQVSDGIMVARGDLGVELPFEEVPLVQKRLIAAAQLHAKPVITATQMLESMVSHPRPTRAEASDVANAILDGTDAVMLSAETAIGQHPIAAVSAMDRIIRSVETQSEASNSGYATRPLKPSPPPLPEKALSEDAIAFATTAAAKMLNSPLIVSFTKGGFTARKVAAHRPDAPIVGVTTEPKVYRQLALIWGVSPVLVRDGPNYDAMLESAREVLLRNHYASPGDAIVVTAGLPWEVSPRTNLLKVEVV